MNLYLTADTHFNHTNMLSYCNRPFKSVLDMNERLIANINSRCKKEDFLWNIGDFMLTKSSQAEVEHSYECLITAINPQIGFIKGNHDERNKIKNTLLYATIQFSHFKYLLLHIPPTSKAWNKKYSFLLPHVDCILCGHVHNAWKWLIYDYGYGKIPIINVGVDVWNYHPVKIDELNVLFMRTKKQL